MKIKLFSFFILLLFAASSCKDTPEQPTLEFTLQDEIELGYQIDEYITSQGRVLDPNQFVQTYSYVNAVLAKILGENGYSQSGNYNWTIRIIEDDDSIIGFSSVGGYIYLTTATLRYLNNEAEFAALLAFHTVLIDEMHSIEKVKANHNDNQLLDLALGSSQDGLEDVYETITETSFGQSIVSNSDLKAFSAICYNYKADQYFDFLNRSSAEAITPEWLLLHPSSSTRISTLDSQISNSQCSEDLFTNQYADFVSTLP